MIHSRKILKAQAEERRKKVAANLLAGLNYRDMASALEASIGTVARDVKIILGRWQEEQVQDIAEWIRIDLRRIDRALNAIWDKVLNGDYQAIDRAIKLMERRAKMIGLDAPVKVAPTDPLGEKEYVGFGLTDDERIARLSDLLVRRREERNRQDSVH